MAPEVNEAVERANRHGVLRSASLMVGAPAAADAIERARRLTALAVGLHVVVVNGRPVLPAERLPDLVDERGEFLSDLVQAGVRFFFRPRVRAQLAAEIRAQFERFKRTGLTLVSNAASGNQLSFRTASTVIMRCSVIIVRPICVWSHPCTMV